MTKFVKYLSVDHLNKMNIALYEGGDVRAENVTNDKAFGARTFASEAAAEAWFESLGTQDTERVMAAISSLRK